MGQDADVGKKRNSMQMSHCPKRYSLPIGLALVGVLIAGAALVLHPCGFGATMMCGVAGLLFIGCGIVFTYLMYRRNADVEWLEAHGQRIPARVVDVREIPSRSHAHKSSFEVVCEACDPLNGRLRRFHSEPLRERPACCCGSSKVDVLTDPSNPALYHVDIKR